MFDFNDPNTFWLNVTNLALGLVTLICLFVVGRSVYLGILEKRAKRVRVTVENDDHAFSLAGLGITMADGGERVDEKKDSVKSPAALDAESHIVRSVN